MRRALLAALVAALLAAAPAAAQTPTQTTTTAGGSFNTAPVLESGVTYRDSIRLGEELFYGVKLAVGQQVKWQVRVLGASPETLDNFGNVELALANPLRNVLVFDDDRADFDGRRSASVQASTDTVVGEGVEGAEEDIAVPGTYYAIVRFTQLFREESSSRLRVYEFPLDVTATVTGQARADVPLPPVEAETPVPEPTAEPEEPEAGLLTGAAAGTEGGDDAIREVLQLVLAGLLVGAVLGGLAAAFRRVAR
jgi:hypothetical protein